MLQQEEVILSGIIYFAGRIESETRPAGKQAQNGVQTTAQRFGPK